MWKTFIGDFNVEQKLEIISLISLEILNKQTCRCSVTDVCQMEFAPGELVQEPGVDSPEQNVVLGQSTFQLGNVL